MEKFNDIEKKTIEKVIIARFLKNLIIGYRKIWQSFLSKRKGNIVCLCIKNNRKANVKIIINNITIYTLIKNSIILESSQHRKNVWIFLRS